MGITDLVAESKEAHKENPEVCPENEIDMLGSERRGVLEQSGLLLQENKDEGHW